MPNVKFRRLPELTFANKTSFWDVLIKNPRIQEFEMYNSHKKGEIKPDLMIETTKKFYRNPQLKKITMTCNLASVW